MTVLLICLDEFQPKTGGGERFVAYVMKKNNFYILTEKYKGINMTTYYFVSNNIFRLSGIIHKYWNYFLKIIHFESIWGLRIHFLFLLNGSANEN